MTQLALEEISLNAWPALQTVVYDGWLLRFAEGYTRRANSVTPLYASSLDLDEKLAVCEHLYGERGLPVIFKLTDRTQPPGLDATLAQRGYHMDAPTAVHLLDLTRPFAPPQSARGSDPSGAPLGMNAPQVSVAERLSTAWLAAFARMSGLSDRNQGVLSRILANIVPPHSYASWSVEGRIIATGLGVVQSGYVGLYDIITDPTHRGRGYGRQIVTGLLAWARAQGANMSYLQVMLDNTPALHLYASVGFRECYRYWYRVAPHR